MRVIGIVQARSSSSRLPGKVLLPIDGFPMIIYQLQRLRRCQTLDHLVLATSSDSSDDELASLVANAGFSVFRGDLHDVLERYRLCASHYEADVVVRLTGDCPLSDPVLIDEIVNAFLDGGWDYLANCADDQQLSVPDGFDAEVFYANLLTRATNDACLPSQREHVTPWFRSDLAGLKWSHFQHLPIRPYYRVTVDDPADLIVIHHIVDYFSSKNINFGVDEVVNYLQTHPEVAQLNLFTMRNQGYQNSLASDPEL